MPREAELTHEILVPPLFTPVVVDAPDVFAHARAVAEKMGAGTLLWSRRTDLFDCAIVLEPEEPLVRVAPVIFVGLSAIADALAHLGPAQKPIHFAWPDRVLIDDGVVGGARLGFPDGAKPNRPPAWGVLGITLRVIAPGDDPGARLDRTALYEEGFGEIEVPQLVESFARHFLARYSEWRDDGFKAMAGAWLERLTREEGREFGLHPSGDLLIKRDGREERRDVLAALAHPSWLHALEPG